MATVVLPGPYRLAYRDWLKFPDDGRLYELVEGELLVTPPPNVEHQRISRDLEFLLLVHLRDRDAGEVFDAPIGVRLSDEDVLEPDLVVVLRAHADRVGVQSIDGPPDIVVEVLSPGTARRDLGPKRMAYARAGVPEYWIVDPESESVEVLAHDRGSYARLGLYRRADTLRSDVLPEFSPPLAAIFGRA